jgi:hypothetical protein
MTTASSGFEFLNTAPIRFDGGPEMEWIAWIEQQKQLVKVANQHKMIAQETLAQANQYSLQQQQLQQREQGEYHSSPSRVEYQQKHSNDRENQAIPESARSFKASIKQPLSSIILGICGVFISTILFAILFTGHQQDKKQYQAHNKMVYQHSLKSIQTGIRSLLMLPVNLVYQNHLQGT